MRFIAFGTLITLYNAGSVLASVENKQVAIGSGLAQGRKAVVPLRTQLQSGEMSPEYIAKYPIAAKYFVILRDLKAELGKAHNALSNAEREREDRNTACPPSKLTVTMTLPGHSTLSRIPFRIARKITEGSSSKLFISDPVPELGGRTLIVKSLALVGKALEPGSRAKNVSFKIKEALLRDTALMQAFATVDGVVPHTYPILHSTIPDDYCFTRTIVSENVGSTELWELPVSIRRDPRQLYELAAKALGILKNFHESGLIHGDVHSRNWLVNVPKDGFAEHAADSLRLIDFGRVDSYIDLRSASHITDNPQPWQLKLSGWNEYLLSPWEILGGKKSRRDDIFRTAEMLLLILPGRADDFFDSQYGPLKERLKQSNPGEFLKQVAALKMNRFPQDSSVPPLLQDFYNAAIDMGFDETPEYDHWIGIFENAARRIAAAKEAARVAAARTPAKS